MLVQVQHDLQRSFKLGKKVDDIVKTIHEAREAIKNADVKTTSECTIHRGKGLDPNSLK